mgnify:CR=1 FL=1
MSREEMQTRSTSEVELAKYWHDLGQRLQLSPDLPPSSLPEPPAGIPLEDPVSLSLRRLIGESHLNEDPDVLQTHAGGETYAGFLHRQQVGAAPQAIVSPTSEQELVAVMLWAAQRDIRILPWGGGAAPYKDKTQNGEAFIVVKLDLMNRQLSINERDRIITMQAGASWQAVREIAQQHGLVPGRSCFRRSCTLGGSIASNPNTCRSPGYGTLSEDIVRIRTITPAGPISLHGPASSAKDLLGIALGSRGTWGIITEVTLNLYPQPERRVQLLANFPTREMGLAALEMVSRRQHHLVAARLIDIDAIDLFGSQSDQQRFFTPRSWLNNGDSWKMRFCVEMAGSREAVSRTRRYVEEILRDHGATIEGNGRKAHLQDGLWYYRSLWHDLWLRGLLTHRLATTVPWAILPGFLLAWEDGLSSVLLSTSGVPGLPITTIHALKHHAQVDTLLLGHQVSGEISEKIQQIEAIQAVANEINHRWNVAFEFAPLVDKALAAAKDALDLSNVMLD